MNFRLTLLTICIAFIGFSSFTTSNETNYETITALKLKSKASRFLQKVNCKAFTVDTKGILKPARGYEIVFLKKKKSFLIKPSRISMNKLLGKVENNLQDIAWWCAGCSSCDKEKIISSGGRTNWTCGGCSPCTTVVNTPSEVVGGIMQSGEWNNF